MLPSPRSRRRSTTRLRPSARPARRSSRLCPKCQAPQKGEPEQVFPPEDFLWDMHLRTLVVDDNMLFAEAVTQLLESDDPVEVEQALRAGAVGCLSKDDLGLRLVEIVLGYAGVDSRELIASFSAGGLP